MGLSERLVSNLNTIKVLYDDMIYEKFDTKSLQEMLLTNIMIYVGYTFYEIYLSLRVLLAFQSFSYFSCIFHIIWSAHQDITLYGHKSQTVLRRDKGRLIWVFISWYKNNNLRITNLQKRINTGLQALTLFAFPKQNWKTTNLILDHFS